MNDVAALAQTGSGDGSMLVMFLTVFVLAVFVGFEDLVEGQERSFDRRFR